MAGIETEASDIEGRTYEVKDPVVRLSDFPSTVNGRGEQAYDIGGSGPAVLVDVKVLDGAREAGRPVRITGRGRDVFIFDNASECRGGRVIVDGPMPVYCADGQVDLTVISPEATVSRVDGAGNVDMHGRSRLYVDCDGMAQERRQGFPVTLHDGSSALVRGDTVGDEEGEPRNCGVYAEDHAQVVATNLPGLQLRGDAVGTVFGLGSAETRGRAALQAFGRISVNAYDDSRVMPMDDCFVQAFDRARVEPGAEPERGGFLADGGLVPRDEREGARPHRPCGADQVLLHDHAEDPTGLFTQGPGRAGAPRQASTAARVLAEAPGGEGTGPDLSR